MRISDWNSDVCSSELDVDRGHRAVAGRIGEAAADQVHPGLGTGAVEHRRERRAAGVGGQAAVGLERIGEVAIVAAQDGVALDADGAEGVPAVAVEVAASEQDAAAVDVGATGFGDVDETGHLRALRSEEHTSELQSLMRISY